eukprot:350318-Chlamydomonas_euryale.AAC.3
MFGFLKHVSLGKAAPVASGGARISAGGLAQRLVRLSCCDRVDALAHVDLACSTPPAVSLVPSLTAVAALVRTQPCVRVLGRMHAPAYACIVGTLRAMLRHRGSAHARGIRMRCGPCCGTVWALLRHRGSAHARSMSTWRGPCCGTV